MPREDGYKNLVPLNKRTKEEQRGIARLGGIASGKLYIQNRLVREKP